MIAAALFLALVSAGAGAPRQAAQAPPGFTGTWERDPERSDDAEEKMRSALQRMQEQMERRRGGALGGLSQGGPRPGGGERRGAGLAQVPEELQIELDRGELHIDDGERLRIYYLDGREHRREMPNGAKLETVAVQQGNTVLIEEKLERGRMDRKLELSADGQTLVITWTIELREMKDPAVIRTVYERVE